MSQKLELPMPNEEFDGGTVIASCWQNDQITEGELWFTLLVLDQEPPYYRVLDGEPLTNHVSNETVFPNIIPATEWYSNSIGGY